MRSALADIERLSINFNIVKFDTEHVLEHDVVPVDVTLELRLIIVPESQIGLDIVLPLILQSSQVE